MRILVIWRLLTVGGVNAGWRNRAIYLKEHGITTDFLYYKDLGGMHVMEDIATVYLTKDEERIVEIIQENEYDLIVVVDTPKAYQWLKKSQYNGPVVIEARTPEIIKLQRNLEGFTTVSPEKIIVPSEHQKRTLSLLVTEPIPILPIYNGIDTNFFKPLKSEEINYEQEPKLQEGKKIVAYIGRLDKRKNWRLLLKIVDKLKERDDVEFWIIGGDKSVERAKFEKKMKKAKLTNKIKWYPVIPYHQMPHMYAKIKESKGCTIATTRAESFGNTFIESMACGVPVVAHGVSSIPEIVEHGKTGYLFNEEDVEDAVDKLEKVFNQSKEEYELLSKAARKRVEDNFSIEEVVKKYKKVINEVVNRDDAK
jgi:L-malate glycosyltransferase